MELSRRGFIGGLLAVVSAPAIVRVENLMQLPAKPQIILPEAGLIPSELIPPGFIEPKGQLLTIDMITREAIKLWTNSNRFIEAIDKQFEKDFAFANGTQWGQELKIRLPKDFAGASPTISDG